MSTMLWQLALASVVVLSAVVLAEERGNYLHNTHSAVTSIVFKAKPFPPPLPPSSTPFPIKAKKKSPPSSASPSPSPSPSPYVPPFDFYILSHTWPPSFCKVNKCGQNPPSKFTLHGLWPQNNTGAQPFECLKNEPLIISTISNLEPRLAIDWPNLFENNIRLYRLFWEKEWQRHGTCSLMKSADYFKFALTLYAKQDIKGILGMGGISPSTGKLEDINKIVAAIQNNIHIGCIAQLQCEQKYLVEVKLCFNKAAGYINCKATIGRCPQRVYFPS